MRRGSACLPGRFTCLLLAGLLVLALAPFLKAQDQDEEEWGNTFFRYDRLQFYGFIKLDASYDTNKMSNSNVPGWVRQFPDRSDDQFNMGVSQSLFGMRFFGPSTDSVDVSARLEFDFQDPDAFDLKDLDTMNSSMDTDYGFQLRHAYMNLDFHGYEILAGQTWDVISPLRPRTVNYSIGWWSGNMGTRRPQIRFTAKSESLEFQAALTRTTGNLRSGRGYDTGNDSGFPTVQARVGWKMPLSFFSRDRDARFGVSGHIGREEIDVGGDHHAVPTWSGNLDLSMPFGEYMTVQGEWFYGQNLDAYYGGIGQGVEGPITSPDQVRARGGWCQLQTILTQRLKFNVGAGLDKPDRIGSTIGGELPIRRNTNYFWNAFYDLTEGVLVGFEMSQWYTTYVGNPDDHRKNTRYQLAFIYRF